MTGQSSNDACRTSDLTVLVPNSKPNRSGRPNAVPICVSIPKRASRKTEVRREQIDCFTHIWPLEVARGFQPMTTAEMKA